MVRSSGEVKTMKRASGGFTLLEIMIAVAVFATVSAALVKNAALTVRQTGLIRDKTVAYWIAENELAALRARPRAAGDFPRTGTSRAGVTMARKDWEVVTSIDSTRNEDVRRIDITVYRDENLEDPLATLSGFIGRH